MTMHLNGPSGSDTSAHVAGRPRTSGPGVKLNGVPLPLHLKEALTEIAGLQNDAYAVMGGETKVSFSDELTEAVIAYVDDFIEKHGKLPDTEEERVAYVARLAVANRAELRERIARAALGGQ